MTQRMHRIEVIESLGRYLFLLLIPLLRGLWHALPSPGSLAEWLSGAWVDAASVLLMLTAAGLRWKSRSFEQSQQGLVLREGVLLRRERSIPVQAISSVSFRQGLLLRLAGAVKVCIYTEGRPLKGADLTLTLTAERAQKLFGPASAPSRLRRKSGRAEIAWFSLFASNALTGTILLLTLLRSAERIAGAQLQQRLLGELAGAAAPLTFLPRIFSVAALVVLAGWAAAFLDRVAEYRGFCAERRGGALILSHGWAAGQVHLLPVSQMGWLDRRQSLLSLAAGLVTVFVRCEGYGRGGRRRAVVFPAVRSRRLDGVVAKMLPELSARPVTLGAAPRSMPRYAAMPFLLCALVAALSLRAWRMFPGAGPSIALVGGAAGCAVLARLAIAVIGRARAGLGADAQRVTLCFPRGFLLHTVTIPRDKITQVDYRQGPGQRRNNLCDVAVWVRGGRGAPCRVKNLPMEAARALLTV